jgi:hypothetical protein
MKPYGIRINEVLKQSMVLFGRKSIGSMASFPCNNTDHLRDTIVV